MTDDELPPVGLDDAGQRLWREATAALTASPDTMLGQTALNARMMLRMEARIVRLQAEIDGLKGVIDMACDRLGGLVEGRPPQPGNFLQRIDELVAKERKPISSAGRTSAGGRADIALARPRPSA